MNNEQLEALRLADDLIKHLGGNTANQAAAELRRLHQSEREGWRYAAELEQERKRLHEVNVGLVEALKIFAACELTQENCASLEVATRRIRAVAKESLAKATGETALKRLNKAAEDMGEPL